MIDPCNFSVHSSQRNEDGPQSWHHTQAEWTAQNIQSIEELGKPNVAVNEDTRLGRISAHTSAAFVFRCVCVSAGDSKSCIAVSSSEKSTVLARNTGEINVLETVELDEVAGFDNPPIASKGKEAFLNETDFLFGLY